jgi:hypothetical protein
MFRLVASCGGQGRAPTIHEATLTLSACLRSCDGVARLVGWEHYVTVTQYTTGKIDGRRGVKASRGTAFGRTAASEESTDLRSAPTLAANAERNILGSVPLLVTLANGLFAFWVKISVSWTGTHHTTRPDQQLQVSKPAVLFWAGR